jgi:alkylation response protein AidB-like acyl-CoA dehydrogenase
MAPAPVETLLTMTALGRALSVEPYLPSAILGTALLRSLGSPAQQASLLPAMATGERIAVPAHGEAGARYDLSRVATAARRDGAGWILEGRKAVVLHAPAADVLLVTARTSGAVDDEAGLSLFAVPAGAAGVALVPYPTIDGQRGADVILSGVALPADALLGPEGGAFPALSAAWDLGVAALCAEAVGVLQATLDATTEYTRTRKQFGVPIARFQALQHRMADMLMHVEQARSMSYLAALHADAADVRERRRTISAAKVTVGQACRFVGQQAVQLHGGMGVTDELAVSHAFKRLLAIEISLGDTEHHLERFIRESK